MSDESSRPQAHDTAGSDSGAMPLDAVMTNGQRRDAQVRVLEQLCELLSAQMSELAIGQQAAIKRSTSMSDRVAVIEASLNENTEKTGEVLDLLSDFKSGFKVLGWLGALLKWAGMIAGALSTLYVGVYMLTHNGQTPGGK